jgi:hypothetical protein
VHLVLILACRAIAILMEAGKRRVQKFSIIPLRHKQSSQANERLKEEVDKIIHLVADTRSIPALINLLDDNDPDIRWIAAESLIKIGRKSIIPLLRSVVGGKRFIYPGKVYHILQYLLTQDEKKEMHLLLFSLLNCNDDQDLIFAEATMALKRNFN